MNHRWALILILFIAAILRLPALDSIPPPLNQDEASRGYDAWCLLQTGADRHGQSWPFFLESFGPGDYTAALSTYLTMPFVAMLGPAATAMRLPDALLSVATVLLIFFLLKPGMGIFPALLAAAVLATNPWHITLTRTAHESGFAPFFLALGLYSLCSAGLLPWPAGNRSRFDRASDDASNHVQSGHTSPTWAALGGLSLAFATWVYPATRVFTPLFCIAIAIIFRHRFAKLRNHVATNASLILGIVIGGAPLWITALTHPQFLAARAASALLADTAGDRASLIAGFFANYASNLGPRNLFVATDDISGLTFPTIGQHLLILAPILLIGLYVILRKLRDDAWAVLLLAWLLIYPLPAAICRDWNPHPMRTAGGILLFPIIAAHAFEFVREYATKLSRRVTLSISCAIIGLWLANTGFFAVQYSRAMINADFEYQNTLIRAIQWAAAHRSDSRFVLVSSHSNQPYIYSLLYAPIQPTALRSLPKISVPGRLGFDQVLRMGDWYFVPSEHRLADVQSGLEVFKRDLSEIPDGAPGLVIQTESESAQGELLASFPSRNPSEKSRNFQVRKWTMSR